MVTAKNVTVESLATEEIPLSSFKFPVGSIIVNRDSDAPRTLCTPTRARIIGQELRADNAMKPVYKLYWLDSYAGRQFLHYDRDELEEFYVLLQSQEAA